MTFFVEAFRRDTAGCMTVGNHLYNNPQFFRRFNLTSYGTCQVAGDLRLCSSIAKVAHYASNICERHISSVDKARKVLDFVFVRHRWCHQKTNPQIGHKEEDPRLSILFAERQTPIPKEYFCPNVVRATRGIAHQPLMQCLLVLIRIRHEMCGALEGLSNPPCRALKQMSEHARA